MTKNSNTKTADFFVYDTPQEEWLWNTKIYKYSQETFDELHWLKSHFPGKKWRELRSVFLCGEYDDIRLRLDFLAEERLHKQLMEELLEWDDVELLTRYEAVLRPKYDDKIRDLYILYVRNGCECHSRRSFYKKYIKYLQKACEFNGGPERVQQLVQKLRESYPKRPALAEELEKAGF